MPKEMTDKIVALAREFESQGFKEVAGSLFAVAGSAVAGGDWPMLMFAAQIEVSKSFLAFAAAEANEVKN